jgi:hypothetical protein
MKEKNNQDLLWVLSQHLADGLRKAIQNNSG